MAPNGPEDDLRKEESVVIETFEGTIEVCLCETVYLQGYERIVPILHIFMMINKLTRSDRTCPP